MSDTKKARAAVVERRTKETNVRVELTLAPGPVDVRTGVGFLDHLLSSLAFHGGLSLSLSCEGDLRVDDHHSAEDCALALGAALKEALGDKAGIRRFGSAFAPLDESLARAVVDDYLSMVETGMLLGERVPLGKLGNASLRYQAARKARIVKNLKTGEDLLVPAKPACLAPKFSFSQSVKDKSSAVDPTILSPDDLESAEDDDRD